MALQHLRSSTANKRPTPAAMSDGQLAMNTNLASPGLFFKDSNGDSVKIGPVHVGTTAPNVTPGAGGQAGNSKGEAWLDTSAANPILKVFNGSAFVAVQPVGTGTVVSTTDTGTVTSTMILDGTILNADINASAAIAGTKISPDFGSQTIATTGVFSHALGAAATPSITFTGDLNTGVYSPGADQVAVATNGTEKLIVLSNGNVGIGTSSPDNKLSVGIASADEGVELKATYNGARVARFGLVNPGVDNTPYIGSVAGNDFGFITSNTRRMTLDSTGRLGIGTTPVVNLDVAPAASTATFRIHARSNTTPVAAIELVRGTNTTFGADGSGDYRIKNDAGNLSFEYGDTGVTTERARIDSSGRLLVGTSSGRAVGFTSLQAPVQVETTTAAAYTAVHHSNDANGCYVSLAKTRGTSAGAVTAVQNNDELGAIRISGSDGTGFVVGAQIIALVDGTPGTNDLPTRLVFSTTADGASSPTERMRIAQNGAVLIGKTVNPGDVGTTGTDFGSGYGIFTRDGATSLYVNRKVDDGTLVEFYQASTIEGTISVSGTTVSYNGAHLSRWSQLPNGAERTEILRGSVLSNIDEMCEWGNEDNEQLNRMKVSDVEGDKNVSGVFQAWDDDDDTYTNDFYCAMTGDFIIRIAEGVTVERGDLLMSAGDGTAKPQDDDIIRSKTIAKVTSTNVSCTYDDGSYCVPCVLMAC